MDMRVSAIVMDDGSDDRSVWTKIGKGNKRKHIAYAWDCVADYE
jgi:glycosyltransferase involved in cell wall biosynthesis